MPQKNVISVDQHALIRLPSDGMKIIELKTDGQINLGRFGTFEVNDIIGYPFGQSFEILEDKVIPIKSINEQEMEGDEEVEEGELSRDMLTKIFSNSAENNQNIINIGAKIQKLTHEDVDELKRSGAASNIGQLIITKMIEGHEGFDKKTIHSQQKYLKRKQAKFLRRFTIEYLNSSLLAQYFIEKDVSKLLDMSEETLGLIQHYSNIRPGGKYLLVDETGGIIIYLMLERMGFEGEILVIHENEHPNYSALQFCNIDPQVLEKTVKFINWLQVLEPNNERIEFEEKSIEELNQMKSTKKAQYYRRLKRASEINYCIDQIENGNFDAFISITTLDANSYLPHIIPLVGGSRPITIYSQYKETLLDIQHNLMNDKRVLAPSILETRVRPYQTIPGRIHPLMTMRGFGGYILNGLKVYAQESVQAVGKGPFKRKRDDSEVSNTPNTPENLETPEISS